RKSRRDNAGMMIPPLCFCSRQRPGWMSRSASAAKVEFTTNGIGNEARMIRSYDGTRALRSREIFQNHIGQAPLAEVRLHLCCAATGA
ncbi:hypothetical protein, partial [Bradyrhizobium yuanmingense]|uniref:hypothetical protein n=1 Tax=Bradyrhizobium yuanmingense TaxID=108015 RepID=UPI001AEC1DB9